MFSKGWKIAIIYVKTMDFILTILNYLYSFYFKILTSELFILCF